MEFFKELIIVESELSSRKEIQHTINIVNNLYNEWKKVGRRKNAVDIISTTANKLNNIDPNIVDKLHDATRVKLAALIIRCFDIPYWKSISEKERIYKKLFGLIDKLQNENAGTETGGSVKDVILTRASASISYNSAERRVFVAYEPKITSTYLRYLFGKEQPEQIVRMQFLKLPADFETLVSELTINHDKAIAKAVFDKS